MILDAKSPDVSRDGAKYGLVRRNRPGSSSHVRALGCLRVSSLRVHGEPMDGPGGFGFGICVVLNSTTQTHKNAERRRNHVRVDRFHCSYLLLVYSLKINLSIVTTFIMN